MTETRQIAVHIPAETHRRLRVTAAALGITMAEAVTQAVDDWTAEEIRAARAAWPAKGRADAAS